MRLICLFIDEIDLFVDLIDLVVDLIDLIDFFTNILLGYDASDKDGGHYSGWKPNGKKLDNWTWIFTELHEKGYVSEWGEDFVPSIFELNLVGFTKWPMTHTMKAFFNDLQPPFDSGNHRTCLGNLQADQHHIEHVKSLLNTYDKVGSIGFHHFLVAHEPTLSQIEALDDGLTDFISYMNEHYSNNTVVIIYGDHGPRYGAYRQTLAGKLEERLPVLWMLIPTAISDPVVHKNLKINTKRLSTVYDLHETLRHIAVYPYQPESVPSKHNYSNSLFFPVIIKSNLQI